MYLIILDIGAFAKSCHTDIGFVQVTPALLVLQGIDADVVLALGCARQADYLAFVVTQGEGQVEFCYCC